MVPMADEGTPIAPPQDADRDGPLVVWRAVGRGAAVTLILLAALSVAQAIVDHNVDNFDDSGWIYPFFVGILAAYAVGGWVAAKWAPDGTLTNGALAALLGFVAWIPIRILIWAVRDEHKGLFTGHSPVLRPGQIFGHLVIASALGMLGGWLAGRAAHRRSVPPPPPGAP
jgi:hypothetical protein